MWNRLRQTIRIGQLVAGVTGLTHGLLLNVFSNWLSGPGQTWLPLIATAFALALLVSGWLWLRMPDRIMLNLAQPRTLRTETEQHAQARRGLVAFVSLYRPGIQSPAKSLKSDEWGRAAANGNYQTLDLPNSNLRPTIEAIATHASRLEHCWLIGTTAQDAHIAGSAAYIDALVAHLQQERDIHCVFHHGSDYSVPLDDDALVFGKTLQMMQKIFDEAKNVGLADPDLIADFTNGIRSMSLGMILSCLDRERDIEMIGTHYDANGDYTGQLFPIIFSFEPVIRNS